MKILLDTHTTIWFLEGDNKLSPKVRTIIENEDTTNFVSIVSIWELAIKVSLNKITFLKGFNHFLELIKKNGFIILPVTINDSLILSSLDFIHRDPFDRMLVAQCKNNELPLATTDRHLPKYGITTIW